MNDLEIVYFSTSDLQDSLPKSGWDRDYGSMKAKRYIDVFANVLFKRFADKDGRVLMEAAWDERVTQLPEFLQAVFQEELRDNPKGTLHITTDGSGHNVSLVFCDEEQRFLSGVTVESNVLWTGQDIVVRMDIAPHRFPPAAFSIESRKREFVVDHLQEARQILGFVASQMRDHIVWA